MVVDAGELGAEACESDRRLSTLSGLIAVLEDIVVRRVVVVHGVGDCIAEKSPVTLRPDCGTQQVDRVDLRLALRPRKGFGRRGCDAGTEAVSDFASPLISSDARS